jgi:hypothetical protein
MSPLTFLGRRNVSNKRASGKLPDRPVYLQARSATRRGFMATCVASMSAVAITRRAVSTPATAETATDYVDPKILQKLPFGNRSHYLQPWRSYLDTVPADAFLRGIGVVLTEGVATSKASIADAARSAISHVRIEISWSELDYEDEARLTHATGFRNLLSTCRRAKVRPLIVLNGHHGLPVPTQRFEGTVVADAAAGERTVRIATTGTVVPTRTGLSNQTEFWAAEILTVRTEGDRWFLARPLPRSLRAGQVVGLATLRYEPFARLDEPRTRTTLAGWARYVTTLGGFVGQALGTEGDIDRGFDLEVWNELSFGTKFLSITNYYEPAGQPAQNDALWAAIVECTAKTIAAEPTLFAGVRVTNGFASTVPWPDAATQPQAVTALSKHPYPPRKVFPADEQRNTIALDADGQPTSWSPTYTAFFPEYAATAIQTETIIRDMGPQVTDIYEHKHGRLARSDHAVPVWLTEFGVNPREAGVSDLGAANRLKAQAVMRATLFYINKGAERVYLYALSDNEDAEYGLAPGSARPHGPGAPPSALTCLARIAEVLRDGSDTHPQNKRALGFRVHDSALSAIQFEGDGTRTNPTMRNIDMLAILPYQSARHRFVIALYFITRDLRLEAPSEQVILDISGLLGDDVTSALYDPLTDTWLDSSLTRISDATVRIALAVTDWPRLLVIQDRQEGAARQQPVRRLTNNPHTSGRQGRY